MVCRSPQRHYWGMFFLCPSPHHQPLSPAVSFLSPSAQQNAPVLQVARAAGSGLSSLPTWSMLGGQSKVPLGCPGTHQALSLCGKCKQCPSVQPASRFPHSVLLTLLSVLASACLYCDWGQKKRRPHRRRLSRPDTMQQGLRLELSVHPYAHRYQPPKPEAGTRS